MKNRFDELDVIIKRRGDKVYASIPRLALYAHGDDVSTALSRLDDKKNLLVNELTEAGELETFDISPRPYKGRALESGGIGRFGLKTVIVVAILVVGGYVLSSAAHRAASEARKLAHDIRDQITAVQKGIGGRQFWSNVEKNLDQMANSKNDLPPKKKEKLLADIRIIAKRWRPFIAEINSALSAMPDSAKKETTAPSEHPTENIAR